LIEKASSNTGSTEFGGAEVRAEAFSVLNVPAPDEALLLGYGLNFADLYSDAGLDRIDQAFRLEFAGQIPQLQAPGSSAAGPSEQLLALARCCESFIEKLFGLEHTLVCYRQRDIEFGLLQTVKYKFVKRKAMLSANPEELVEYDPSPARQRWTTIGIISEATGAFDEMLFARHVQACLEAKNDAQATSDLELARQYSAWACLDPMGQQEHLGLVLFDHAKAVDPAHLLHHLESQDDDLSLPIQNTQNSKPDRVPGNTGNDKRNDTPQNPKHRVIEIKSEFVGARQGFDLSDAGPQAAKGLDQARYCLICHTNKTDSCSHGMPGKDIERNSCHLYTPPNAPSSLSRNALGMALIGCPLGEKISEFQLLRREGRPVAALAMITRDNPMLAATGHRICNDCSRACVFQQQTPVDIPASETRILEDVLALPWGVEVYSLLTRWNPLRSLDRSSILGFSESKPRCDSGKKVLVTGLGPAGFTLAHHLLNLGHQVMAIDGQKIEPLPDDILARPIKSWAHFQESLAVRVPAGFGGVAEYGITIRWNKNYLKLIRLLLERRPRFHLHGGVRLGSQLSIEQAFELGFNHLALALGAGKPKLWEQKNTLPKGVRMASDFLMALQLTGAYREDSLAALQIELPAAVIGAGLTAVDAATETLAYYALQVERFAKRHQELLRNESLMSVGASQQSNHISNYLDRLVPTDRVKAEKFIAHGEILQEERRLAAQEGRRPNLLQHLQAWGGVTLIYRRALQESPAYRLNHEELQKGMEEGIHFLECTEVLEVVSDEMGELAGLRLQSARAGSKAYILPAKSALLALGAERNDFLKLKQDLTTTQSSLNPSESLHLAEGFGIKGHRGLSILGDMHPNYAGSVVKAMASAARASTLIDRLLMEDSANALSNVTSPAVIIRSTVTSPLAISTNPPTSHPTQDTPTSADLSKVTESFEAFSARVGQEWRAQIADRTQFRKGILELGLRAPAATKNFQPGQFFKLQNFEAHQVRKNTASNAAEPLAMTGASADPRSGRISTIILQDGASSSLTSDWSLGQEVVLMGPCGTPSEIPSHKKVLLLGGGLGNAVLFSIGQACRAQGCEVFYVAAYRSIDDLFHQAAIEAAADRVLWCFESFSEGLPECRSQDQVLQGTILCGLDQLKSYQILSTIEHLLVIGSQPMMAAVALACRTGLASALHPQLKAFASVNAPMQCMMKGICGQCLQAVSDPATGQKKYIFACEAQDQSLLDIDFDQLKARLAQNRVLEVQHSAWQKLALQTQEF
jgi:NADPH-dependent glutamate synthase beta subunit-like oxidoreductase/NAD(P)H-flavin reductase